MNIPELRLSLRALFAASLLAGFCLLAKAQPLAEVISIGKFEGADGEMVAKTLLYELPKRGFFAATQEGMPWTITGESWRDRDGIHCDAVIRNREGVALLSLSGGPGWFPISSGVLACVRGIAKDLRKKTLQRRAKGHWNGNETRGGKEIALVFGVVGAITAAILIDVQKNKSSAR